MSTAKIRPIRRLLIGARVTLGLEQEELARLAGLDRKTVSNFETSNKQTRKSTREAIQAALEGQGIVFTNGSKPGFYIDTEKRAQANALLHQIDRLAETAEDEHEVGSST